MRCRFVLPALAAAVALSSAPAVAASPDDIAGLWLTEDKEGAVEIAACGDRRCGRIRWLKTPTAPGGGPVLDGNNPDHNLRSRPVCGLQIISPLTRATDGSWSGGRVYDPDAGKTYNVEVRRSSANALRVTGYLGIKALSETQTWTLAPANLGVCSSEGRRAVR